MLGFSHSLKEEDCVWFLFLCTLDQADLLVLLGHILEPLRTPWSFSLHAAKPPEEPGPGCPGLEMETAHTLSEGGGKNPAAFSTII